ncbi:MAG TPA: class I adenylate-forming enzyme family protein, partial [Alphaproteobacteria bacterium]
MILGDPKAANAQTGGQTTLDMLFRQAAARRPDAIALADPPNRANFTDGPPLRLSYAEADRIVSAIAAQLRQLDFQADTVVGIQLPNTVESVLTMLGVLRAGMIAAPLPLLWRRAELTAALGRIGAKIIVTTSWVGDVDHCHLAMQVAADMFSIRHVCGFGERLADGIIPLDDLLNAAELEPPALERQGNPADHVALVTFDVTPDGLVPVARNHTQLIAGGLVALLEGGLQQDAVLLGCCTTGSFAGLALTLVPWLLTGGTLALHQPFDPVAFSVQ